MLKIVAKTPGSFLMATLIATVLFANLPECSAEDLKLTYSEPGKKLKFEPGMRPSPVRSYWVNLSDPSPDTFSYLLKADGSVTELKLKKENGHSRVSFKAAMEDGAEHGPNNVYVVNKAVRDSTLFTKVAKHTAIHHSCGWGHEHRFSERSQVPQTLEKTPLEISCRTFWNGNFHFATRSGDTLECAVQSFGKPAIGSKVTVTSGSGWSKTFAVDKDGKAEIQLVNDYFASSWEAFNPRHYSPLFLKAEYEIAEEGLHAGQAYNKVKMTSTYSWRYAPSRKEYVSYSYGLLLGTTFLVGPAIAVYRYRRKRNVFFQESHFNEKD